MTRYVLKNGNLVEATGITSACDCWVTLDDALDYAEAEYDRGWDDLRRRIEEVLINENR